MKKLAISALVVSLLVGCAALEPLNARQRQLTRAGQSEEYIQGDRDGCSSGYQAAGHPNYRLAKDTGRFDSDSDYRQGWTDGYDACKTRYLAIRAGR